MADLTPEQMLISDCVYMVIFESSAAPFFLYGIGYLDSEYRLHVLHIVKENNTWVRRHIIRDPLRAVQDQPRPIVVIGIMTPQEGISLASLVQLHQQVPLQGLYVAAGQGSFNYLKAFLTMLLPRINRPVLLATTFENEIGHAYNRYKEKAERGDNSTFVGWSSSAVYPHDAIVS